MSETQAIAVAAGILFKEGPQVLCGYTPKLEAYSGFGGKMEQSDGTTLRTAIRETIEELFELQPTEPILKDCEIELANLTCIQIGTYSLYVASFEDYTKIVNILFNHKIYQSPIYNTIPYTIYGLVYLRDITKATEITDLDIINYNINQIKIDKNFIDDCQRAEELEIYIE